MFLHLQKILRDVNSHHDIDLSSPHGVTIEGRHYPAVHKHLMLSEDASPRRDEYSAHFQIPLENGTRVLVDTSDEGHMSSQLHVPTINFDHEGAKSYDFGPAYHVGDDAYWEKHKTPDWYGATGSHPSIHDTIREYSRLPQQGTFYWDTSGGYKAFSEVRPNHTRWMFGVEGRDLNEEDLAEHKKNYKFNQLHGPMHISTQTWLPDGQKDLKYRYNIKTEQMHLMDRNE